MLTLALAALSISTRYQPMNSSLVSKLDSYDVVWKTPSQDASGSMPIGNGEVVLNVWVEAKTGDLLFYIARTDALSEICRILKLARVRVHLSPNPFKSATDFRQHLHLHDGRIEISGGGANLNLFVNSGSHVIAVSGTTAKPTDVTATIECWRNEKRKLPEAEKHSAWAVHDAPFNLEESADVFVPDGEHAVTWYHRNETTVVPQLMENQSLTGLSGIFDPLIHRTFGGRITGEGFERSGERSLKTQTPTTHFAFSIATHSAQRSTVGEWISGLHQVSRPSATRTENWWHEFWERSWVFAEGDQRGFDVPQNSFPLRLGVDSNGQNKFPGEISDWIAFDGVRNEAEIRAAANGRRKETLKPVASAARFKNGFTLQAFVRPDNLAAGRVFDKITAGGTDGFLFDMQPGGVLRLIVGNTTAASPPCLKNGVWQHVAAIYDANSGSIAIYLDGEAVMRSGSPSKSPVTLGYVLQRYVQACQGRGEFPIKFNGGYYTVEPKASGRSFNADWRNWGDCHWFQNVRHMYHPMLQSGDYEMMEPFFQLYEAVRPLAESRTQKYHRAKGAYFPETMTVFGTYSGGDYGWDRSGKQPKDVDCQYWQYAWNQGPELVDLMLDYWDYTRDEKFLEKRLLPMATSVLQYFDTRFRKDLTGKVVLNPTQVVETYWHDVVNDMPTTSGLISITNRLAALPPRFVPSDQRKFFLKMKAACPELPLEMKNGLRELAPAQRYNPATSNVENGQLYGVWPSSVVTLAHPALLPEAKAAYANRLNHLDVGWGYDGNVAALLGMTDEAARILRIKCANSNAAYRWPATWGPNFDWLPDQNHGGNLLTTANLMLIQGEPMEAGGAIRVLPAWPQMWDVEFKLHAPGKTTVECSVKKGKVVQLDVSPAWRKKDLILPHWASMPEK